MNRDELLAVLAAGPTDWRCEALEKLIVLAHQDTAVLAAIGRCTQDPDAVVRERAIELMAALGPVAQRRPGPRDRPAPRPSRPSPGRRAAGPAGRRPVLRPVPQQPPTPPGAPDDSATGESIQWLDEPRTHPPVPVELPGAIEWASEVEELPVRRRLPPRAPAPTRPVPGIPVPDRDPDLDLEILHPTVEGALARDSDDERIEGLLALMVDPLPLVRQQALRELGVRAGGPADRDLEPGGARPPQTPLASPPARVPACSPAVLEAARRATCDPDPGVCFEALRILARFRADDPATADGILESLEDRRGAAGDLARLLGQVPRLTGAQAGRLLALIDAVEPGTTLAGLLEQALDRVDPEGAGLLGTAFRDRGLQGAGLAAARTLLGLGERARPAAGPVLEGLASDGDASAYAARILDRMQARLTDLLPGCPLPAALAGLERMPLRPLFDEDEARRSLVETFLTDPEGPGSRPRLLVLAWLRRARPETAIVV